MSWNLQSTLAIFTFLNLTTTNYFLKLQDELYDLINLIVGIVQICLLCIYQLVIDNQVDWTEEAVIAQIISLSWFNFVVIRTEEK